MNIMFSSVSGPLTFTREIYYCYSGPAWLLGCYLVESYVAEKVVFLGLGMVWCGVGACLELWTGFVFGEHRVGTGNYSIIGSHKEFPGM